MAKCSSCDGSIVWAVTEPKGGAKGRAMPLDAGEDGRAKEVPNGNLVIVGEVAGKYGPQPKVRYVAAGAGKFVSHFATCPNASEHRRR